MPKQITSKGPIYSYRNGKKVYLTKSPDQFIVRANEQELSDLGINKGLENISPASTRVTVRRDSLNTKMKAIRKKVVVHHVYTQKDVNTEFLITDRILVTFKTAVNNEMISKFMAKYSLIIKDKYADNEFLFQLTNNTEMNPVKLVVLINEKEKKLIESCEHDLNKRMMKYAVNIPTDNKYVQQWHLHSRFINAAFDPRSSSNSESAWHLLNHFGSADVVVGVTDDGCKLAHTDFDSVNKFAQWGYMSGSSLIHKDSISANPQNMYQTNADHGTACNGVIGAEVDGVLTVGSAPGCRLLPIKWQSSGPSLSISDSKLLTVLNFIADKVDILSNSWGSSPESNWSLNVVNKISQLAINGGRRGKGILFLWAAGNENCPIKHSGSQDIPYDNGYDQHGNWVGVRKSRIFEHNLVDIPGVMHIAALASNGQRSHYSNYGNGISLCAPSSNSHEYWRMPVTGLGILTTSGVSPFFDPEFGGTSSATPLVAGIAALVISANQNLSALEVVSILQHTAGKNLNMTPYAKTPPSPIDPNTSWDISPVAPHNNGNFNNIGHADGTWSGWFGFGKVDAAAAVAEALRLLGNTGSSHNTITNSSTPNKSIPDNTISGISDQININGSGSVVSIKLDLNITHTYIGDLILKIKSPMNTEVVLHNRNGASTKNIIKTFDMLNTPGLTAFIGQAINGNWTLTLQDLASVDTGVLSSWALTVEVAQTNTINKEDIAGVSIPDNNPVGIERTLNFVETGTIKELEAGIDITHSYISDLIVNLISPQGTTISLHNRAGNDSDNIIRLENFNNNVNLRSLAGQNFKGNWKIVVSDVVGQDIGKLNKWSLKILKN